jgi:hypothetical protein
MKVILPVNQFILVILDIESMKVRKYNKYIIHIREVKMMWQQ